MHVFGNQFHGLYQACAVPWKIFLCCGMLWHAAACFYLHMWVPTHLLESELTNKRQHA